MAVEITRTELSAAELRSEAARTEDANSTSLTDVPLCERKAIRKTRRREVQVIAATRHRPHHYGQRIEASLAQVNNATGHRTICGKAATRISTTKLIA